MAAEVSTHTRRKPGTERRVEAWVWLMGALAALLAFRLGALALNGTDLFFDEAQYWTWSREPAFGYYSKPPLIAWIIAAATGACGDSEFCVRLPSPILHALTAFTVFAIGRRLYDETVGLWSALAYATLPGVSLSSGIISTDVPLLLAWALALLFFAELMQRPSWLASAGLGLALGLGLNAKYAMLFFLLCAALCFVLVPERRDRLRDARLWAAVALGLLLIAPNVAWNAANSFATVAHTADNANWAAGRLLRPEKAAEFFLAQFGVMGPILFAGLLMFIWRARRSLMTLDERDRLLLAFSVPIIVAMTVQALLSRAHANWAATAYIAATVLVTAAIIRRGEWRWLKSSLALHLVVAVMIAAATWQAGAFTLPGGADPFARTLGWRRIADVVRAELTDAQSRQQPYAAIVAEDRETTAELLYYLRDADVPLFSLREGAGARDHYEMSRPYTVGTGEPALLVSLGGKAGKFEKHFGKVTPLRSERVPTGPNASRTVHLFAVSGLMPRGQ